MLEVWRDMTRVLAPVAQRIHAGDRRIENIAGGVLEFWSLDNPQAGRSRKYKRVIVDECAFAPGLLDIWNYAIHPTLLDLSGDAYFFSTPRGLNDFYTLYCMAETDANWHSWQMPSSVNPFLPIEELENMRRTMPERVYRQEILAEFIRDGAGVIRYVRDAVRPQPEAPETGHTYVAGIDWALTTDRTVITIADATRGAIVQADGFNGIDYRVQRERIAALCRRWNVAVVIAEANAMGKPNNDELRHMGLPVRDFTTTNATKADIIEALAGAFENRRITIPNNATLIAELESLEAERTPSGMVRYAAPAGRHDDYTMSAALAWSATAGAQSIFL